jgi:hypothetical protein
MMNGRKCDLFLVRDIEEPLEESAPLAWRLAPQLCYTDPASGENCAWIHGLWQYLRLMGLVTTPQHHAEFYRKAFSAVTNGLSSPRVLISGTADYSMLAHVLAAFRGREPRITVADRCDTPLRLNQWYAARLACEIRTRRCDILELADDDPYDVVCTHSFLGQFSPLRRVELLGKWRQLLCPGGLAITVNRIRPSASPAQLGFAPDQARAFRDVVMRKARALRLDPVELAEKAEIYTKQNRIHSVRSGEEIRMLFEGSGFRVEQLSCASVAKGGNGRVNGPTMLGTADYASVVATRI